MDEVYASRVDRSRRAGRGRGRPRVEVHETRYGRELRVDGTFASFYEPGRVATGSVWDAIAAPLLALAPERRRRVLVLGLGGGSVARLTRALAPRARIVGVELDADVIAAARRDFGLDELRIELVAGDARDYLVRGRSRFDAVIEDVFVGAGDAVHKPEWLPRPGHRLAARRVAPGGVLVSNTLDESPQAAAELRTLFPRLVAIGVEGYDNRILAAGSVPALSGRSLRRAVAANPELAPTLARLRFRSLAQPQSGDA